MATIVTQNQNPSWGSAALMLLAPLLTDALKRHHEANANRKLNAARGEFVNALQQQNNSYNPMDEIPDLTPTPNYNDGWGHALYQIGGASQNGWDNALTGNNSNVWRDVFHQSKQDTSPFDEMNFSQQQAQTQNNSIPTQADIARASAQILANPRFGMIDPAQFGEVIKPYADAMNLARQEQELKELAGNFNEAGNLSSKRDILAGGLISKQITPENFLNLARTYAPVQRQINTGTATIDQMLDAWTGKPISSQVHKMSMTPSEQANANYRNAALAQNGNQFDEELKFKYYDANQRNDFNMANLNWDKEKFGLNIDTQKENARIAGIYERLNKLSETEDKIWSEYADADEATRGVIKTQLENIRAEKEYLNGLLRNGHNKEEKQVLPPQGQVPDKNNVSNNGKITPNNTPTTSDDNNIWDYFTDGKKFGVSSEYSPRILDGKARFHHGVDVLATAGSSLKVPNIKGMRNFQVKNVACDKGGYGNYVDLEADYFGHKVNFRFAHLMDSDRLKQLKAGQKLNAGQLIAQTGNTGRVRGDNGGYHLHIETSLDGKRIDPRTFFKSTKNYENDFVKKQQAVKDEMYKGIFNTDSKGRLPILDNNTPIFSDYYGNDITNQMLNELFNTGVPYGVTWNELLEAFN